MVSKGRSGNDMEVLIKSEYLSQEQSLELRETFLGITQIEDLFGLVDRIGEFVAENGSADEHFDKLFACLKALQAVVTDEELVKDGPLVLLSPSYGVGLLGLLLLLGVFGEDDLRIAFSEKANLFNNKTDHSA